MTTDTLAREFEQFKGQLKSYILRMTASVQDTKDILQDTYVKAHSKIDTFKGDSSLKTWVFAIASNLARDLLRAKKRWPENVTDICKEAALNNQEFFGHSMHIRQTSPQGNFEIKEHIAPHLSSFVTRIPGQCVCNARFCHRNKVVHFREHVHVVVKSRITNASVPSSVIPASSLQTRTSLGIVPNLDEPGPKRPHLSSFVTRIPGQCVCNARFCHRNKVVHFREHVHVVVKSRITNVSVPSSVIPASSLQTRTSLGIVPNLDEPGSKRPHLSSFVTRIPGQCVCNARFYHRNKFAHFQEHVHVVVKSRITNALVPSSVIPTSSLQTRTSLGVLTVVI